MVARPVNQTVYSEKLQAIKCERGEVYLWNPRLYYEKVLCPLCPGNPPKEITTPHFRKHLEQVHTIEGIILRYAARIIVPLGFAHRKV